MQQVLAPHPPASKSTVNSSAGVSLVGAWRLRPAILLGTSTGRIQHDRRPPRRSRQPPLPISVAAIPSVPLSIRSQGESCRGGSHVLVCGFAGGFGGAAPRAVAQEHWVATWAASPQTPRFAFPRFPTPAPPAGRTTAQPAPTAPAAPAPPAAGQSACPPPFFPAPPTINNQTVRMIVHTSIGGHRVRVQLSNAFGTSALQIGAAHIALHDKDSAIVAGSDHALTFSGRASVAIPARRRNSERPARFRSARARRFGDQPVRSGRGHHSDDPSHRPAHHLHLAAR